MDVSRVSKLLELITLLQSGRRYDADTLAEQLGVSRRTFFRYMKLLEEAGIPCGFDRSSKTYIIEDTFFLPPLDLGLPEALGLLLVTRKFLTRDVHPMYQHASAAALKIESILPGAVLKDCGAWLDSVSVRWPQGTSVEGTASLFHVIQESLANQVRLKMRYDALFDQHGMEVVVEPLRLVFMSRAWFLIGRSLTHGGVRTFKLDRILDVTPTGDTFEPSERFSEQAYFGAAWRMIPEGRMYEIKLRFSHAVAASVEDVLWHESQVTSRLSDGRLVFEAHVDGLGEIMGWVLSFGDQVEVLNPPELRQRIATTAHRMATLAAELDGEGAI